jgi:Zn-dependent protease/predicted transcriptional regulator
MNWSFRVAQISGIDIKIHITFILIPLLGALQWSAFGPSGAAFGVLLMLLLFTCVVLHELGHSIAAQRFGIPVREIVLLPLGGIALLGRNPSKPIQELIIAAAGPLVNVVIAAFLWVALSVTSPVGLQGLQLFPARGLEPSWNTLLVWLFTANVTLVLFNLIPAFPLDGGRMLRAGLAMMMNDWRATQIATVTGQAIAIVIGAFAVFSGNIFLILVAAFVFFGAGQENAEGQARTVLTTLRVGDAYNKHALALAPGDPVSRVVDYILTSYQPDFAVVHGNQLLGIVTRNDVLRALAVSTRDVYVTEIMRREFVRVDANLSLDEVRQYMGKHNARVVAVFDGEQYLGLVSIEDISEALTVITFVQNRNEARRVEQVGA